MHKRNYTISGTNPKTGRLNKRKLRAFDEKGCKALAMAVEELIEPIEIIEVSDNKPSLNQLSYAAHLGIQIMDQLTYEELSDLISFKVEDDNKAAESLKRYGAMLGAEFSEFAGARTLSDRIMNVLSPNVAQKAAFYIWVVYNLVMESEITSLQEAPNKKVFEDFGIEMAQDEKFIKSFASECQYGLDNSFSILFTHAYIDHFAQSRAYCVEKTKRYLQYKFNIERWRQLNATNKQSISGVEDAYNEYSTSEQVASYIQLGQTYTTGRGAMPKLPNPQSKGCAPVILFLFLIVLVVSAMF